MNLFSKGHLGAISDQTRTAMSGTFSISCLYHPPLSQLSQPKAARPRGSVIAENLDIEYSCKFCRKGPRCHSLGNAAWLPIPGASALPFQLFIQSASGIVRCMRHNSSSQSHRCITHR